MQGHYYPGASGLMEEGCVRRHRAGRVLATCQFSHGNPGIIGGGMMADDFIRLPIIHWYRYLPPAKDLPRWGLANKQWMRDNFKRTQQIYGPIQDIPNPDSRVRVAPDVRGQVRHSRVPFVRHGAPGNPENGGVSCGIATWSG